MKPYIYFITLIFFLCLMSCSASKTTVKSKPTYSKPSSRPTKSNTSITSKARSLINKPYRYGGKSPSGFDCSGLVQYVYLKNNVQLPRRSADQARIGRAVSLQEARLGDLIFFKNGGKITHVGIVSNTNGKFPSMIHSSSSKGVIEVDLDQSEYWRKRFAFIRRP